MPAVVTCLNAPCGWSGFTLQLAALDACPCPTCTAFRHPPYLAWLAKERGWSSASTRPNPAGGHDLIDLDQVVLGGQADG